MLLTFSWEQRRLGEVISYEQPQRYIVEGKIETQGEIPVLTAGKTFILGYVSEIDGIKYDKDGVIIFDDFTTDAKYIDFPFKIKSSAIKILSLFDDEDDLYFMYNLLCNIKYRPQNHERHWISIFSNFKVCIPSKMEQKKISRFFELLDHHITVQQRKLVSKDEVMNLFLCKSNTLVDVDVYANSWEQRRLGEVANIYDGTHQTPKYEKNGIMFLSVENIDTLKSDKYISEKAFKDEYKNYPQKNDILMTRIGDVGRVNIVETEELIAFYVSLALLKPFNIVSKFLLVEMQSSSFQRQLRRRTLVTAIPQKINKEEIGRITIFVPYEEEQRKIGHLLRRIDHHITFQQRM